jgi:predicted PurR-regulated permease PerM
MTASWPRMVFWIGLVLALVYVIHMLRGILLPFAAGAAIAFFLDPLADRLERVGLGRTLSTFIVLTGFFLCILLFLLLLVPLLQHQIVVLAGQIPQEIDAARNWLDSRVAKLNRQLSAADITRIRNAIGGEVGTALGAVGQVATSLLTGGVAVANILSLVFITPIVAFFLLRDWDLLMARLDSWLPRRHLETVREQAKLINETLSGFVRGQAMVCLLMGVFYAIGLTLIGLDSGLVLGLIVGFLIFIPFLGGLSGGLVCVLLAFAQFRDWHQPLFIVILFLVGQSLEGNVVTPKLVGDRVGLHPVWIIFALLAAGAMFGFLGVVIAVPLAAVIGVLARFAIQRYLESPLYDPSKDGAKQVEL